MAEMPEIYSNRLAGKQVRILELLPGSGNEAIKTRLITCDLSDRPDFEAVSYVWGEQTVKCQISCEGADITITENLHDALLQIRLPRMSRQIWADAVCVNQQDLVERSQQVSLMQLIFNQASRVLVWLGRDCGEEVHLAVGAIDLIYECCISYAQAQNLNLAECMSFKHLESVRVVTNKSLDSAFDNETWLSISRFYARPWFERVWCAQEIILGRHGIILIDGCHVTWERVGVAAAFLTAQISQPTQYSSGHRQCDSAYRCVSAAQLYFHQGKDTLLGNLETFCIRKATDPRDIVYGLLGLLDYRLAGRILEPNYSKNTAEVYIDVVMTAVNDGSGLRILSNVQHEDSYQNKDDLPSWVPYWPRQRSVSFLDRQTWYAGGQQAAEVSFPSRREMAVRGIVFEEIVSVSDIHPTSLDEYGSVHPFLDLMLALWSEVNTSNKSGEPSRLSFETLCRTLTGGHTASGEVVYQLNAKQRWEFYADYIAFIDYILQYTGQRSRTYTPPDLAGISGNWQRYARGVRYACRSRRIFRTQEGSLGLGPACTSIGDRVCVLKGGKVPYVLRPTKDSFYFLGECYMDDIMRGELYQRDNIKYPKSTILSVK